MKSIKYLFLALAGVFAISSCNDDDFVAGNPVMDPKTEFSTAMFGDSLQFTVNASDNDVPLSTLKAQLFYGEEKVSETVIRTKTNDEYSGKIFVPFYANIPNATATLKLVLQNINFTITEKEYDLPLSRPDYEYLTLVSDETDEDGNAIEYRMERQALYEYAVTARFPQKVKGHIKTPVPTAQANEIVFGWQGGEIKEGTTSAITFSNSSAGKYTIAFNTFSYNASPFVKLLIEGKEMEMVDDNNYRIDLALTTGQEIEITGIPDMDEWWIDADYFSMQDNGKLKFLPMGGNYRITANFTHKYFIVEVLSGGALATLQEDGTGAIWIKGNGIGKPSLSNVVGWNEFVSLCMAPIEKGKYQITVVGGKTINTSDIDFKFFHQNGWGGEFKHDAISTTSNLVFVGNGENGGDSGNIKITEGNSLDAMGIYTITVDVTAGNDKAVLTIKKEGEEEIEEVKIKFDGEEMQMVDLDNYKIEKEFTQGQEISVSGITGFSGWWIDPDYFTMNNGKLTFLPISGKYRVTANLALKYFVVEAMNGDDLATLNTDGAGAVWVIGYDIGKPSLANQIGWNDKKGLCMAPIGNKKYQITVEAGTNVNLDKIEFKFFHQQGWGGEFTGNELTTNSDFVIVKSDGNLALEEGKTLVDGELYVFTLDVSAGNDKAVLTVTQK
ncbi:DUF5125 domain-containing protein [Bacteroides sp. 519]|uniref:DUF5125 domain-containing protein n=1 Tax=Bacteroides sp. 519 TaxID=2302937 RepID=UPI0013CFDCF7|nr:DUF5125 domain-containing protein [Bacteroides sp. 519]NDV57432.1 DUF5125 domain-containing protein [Bacteroides sp. 519]